MTAISWFWLVAFGLLVVGCMSQLWWIFRRQQNWPVRWLNLIIVIVSLSSWWLWPLPVVRGLLFTITVLAGSLEFILIRQFLNDQDAVFARSLDK